MNHGPLRITLAILVVLALLVTACAPTATPTPTARPTRPPMPTSTPALALHPDWTSYTNANQVHDVAFDRGGNLWAASSGGVVRWDPTDGTYTKYTTADGLADNHVSSIGVAADGALWFGTWGGVSRYLPPD